MSRVVVVDDDPVFLKLVTRQLMALCHEVRTFPDGTPAFEHLLRQPGTCDLLITDLMMPGMDGRRLIQELRRDPNHRSLPIILVSAANEARDLGAALDDPKIAFMGKPIEMFSLSAAISRLLGRRHSEMVSLSPEQVSQLRQSGPLRP